MQLNLLDRLIAYVAPGVATRRMRARMAMTFAYDGARTSRRTDGWNASGAGPNSAISADLVPLRKRANDLARNNAIASGAASEWAGRVAPIRIQIRAKSAAVQQQVEEAWQRSWSELSAEGLPDFDAMQNVMVRSAFISGECLIRQRIRRADDGLNVPIQFQLLEGDFLDQLKTFPTASGGVIINGVEFDSIGRRVQY